MRSRLVSQGFPVRSGCIQKVIPPKKRKALSSQVRVKIGIQPFQDLAKESAARVGNIIERSSVGDTAFAGARDSKLPVSPL